MFFLLNGKITSIYKKIFTNKSPFSMVKVSLSGYTIYLRLFSMKECDAIRPGLNCFISMIISVDTLCGFAPYAIISMGAYYP